MCKTDAWNVGRSPWFIILRAPTKLSNLRGWEWERFDSAEHTGQACNSVNTRYEWGSCPSQECLSYLMLFSYVNLYTSRQDYCATCHPTGHPSTIHHCNLMVSENNGGATSLHFYLDTTIGIILSSKSTLNHIRCSFTDKPNTGYLF